MGHPEVSETHGQDRHWNILAALAHQHWDSSGGLGHVWDRNWDNLAALRVGHLIETRTPWRHRGPGHPSGTESGIPWWDWDTLLGLGHWH